MTDPRPDDEIKEETLQRLERAIFRLRRRRLRETVVLCVSSVILTILVFQLLNLFKL